MFSVWSLVINYSMTVWIYIMFWLVTCSRVSFFTVVSKFWFLLLLFFTDIKESFKRIIYKRVPSNNRTAYWRLKNVLFQQARHGGCTTAARTAATAGQVHHATWDGRHQQRSDTQQVSLSLNLARWTDHVQLQQHKTCYWLFSLIGDFNSELCIERVATWRDQFSLVTWLLDAIFSAV